MKTVGIIAEYNPFHNGHAYQIAEARRLTGADCAVIVMSGDFVQRGTPAVFDKYTRTKAALLSGADLVFELPVYFATASAEAFAFGGVSMLTEMGADFICFGSEAGDINVLDEIAEVLAFEPSAFKQVLNNELKSGKSFPAAREKALAHVLGNREITDVLREPNNLLGIEYLKALKKLEKSGKKVPAPVTVSRLGSYHSNVTVSPAGSVNLTVSAPGFASASAIRMLLGHGSVSEIKKHVPDAVYDLYSSHLALYNPVTEDALSGLLSYALLFTPQAEIAGLSDWNEDLANRVLTLAKGLGFAKTAEALKSKNITLTRAYRMLLSLILKTDGNLLSRVAKSGVPYLRLLGMRDFSSETAAPKKNIAGNALKAIKKLSSVPVINRLAPAEKLLEGDAGALLEADIRAARLYDVLMKSKEPDEYRKGIIRL